MQEEGIPQGTEVFFKKKRRGVEPHGLMGEIKI
jgi:hypothetical protein